MGNILELLKPIGDIFHYIFYEPVYNVLMLIFHGTHSFALAVIIVTLLLRLALIPLTRKQLKSSREMQVLQPKLKELQQRYRGEPQRLMEEQRRLYKEHGVSPLSGCLPLLVQMPVLYALYYAFYTVLPGNVGKINNDIYPFLPHISHAPGLSFLWMNLGQPDQLHVLPILAAVLTFVQLRMAMPIRKKQPGQASDPTSQATGMMQYIMPFMTLFIGWRFYSGLCLYWAISTGFSAVQQYFINGRNWGSLFLGVPGLEHLVPAPKEPPTATTTIRPASPRALPAASNAVVPSAPAEGGLRAIWRQMREAALTQRAATETQGATGKLTGQIVDADTAVQSEESPTRTTRSAADRRTRPAKSGAMLIKPAPAPKDTGGSDATDAAIAEATDTTILPERAIASDNGSNGNGANGNGANGNAANSGKNGKAASNGSANNGANGGKNGNASYSSRPGTSQRKPAAKGPAGARAKSNRPKGGR